MQTQKKIILFGAGSAGQAAMHYYGPDRIFCFADNNKHGQNLYEKAVISFEDLLKIHKEYDVIISVNFKFAQPIQKQCQASGIPAVYWGDIMSWRDYKSNPEIRKFRNCHFDKRCFLIGNGPSLTAADLDELAKNKEISIGCNKIYNIFTQTKWRPNYYFASDAAIIPILFEEFAKTDVGIKFIPNPAQLYYTDSRIIIDILTSGLGMTYFYNRLNVYSKNNGLPFSEDPSRALHVVGTVMYPMIQMAVYMGFCEIYLVGVDNNMASMGDLDAYNSSKSHFYTENPQENEAFLALRGIHSVGDSALELRNHDYHVARMYCDEHGIKVFNATRGGELDVFERVDFDSLF